MRYASQTSVSPDRSKAEIERILRRYGATSLLHGWNENSALLGFAIQNRQVKILLPLPSLADAERTPSGRRRRGAKAILKTHDQLVRARWRALGLVVKAKLEAVASGISTVDQEFLAWTVLPGGKTVGEHVLPAVAEAYETGRMQPLLPSGRE